MEDETFDYIESHDRVRLTNEEVEAACRTGLERFMDALKEAIPEVEHDAMEREDEIFGFLDAGKDLAKSWIDYNSSISIGQSLSQEQAREMVNTAVAPYEDRSERESAGTYRIKVGGSEHEILVTTAAIYWNPPDAGEEAFHGIFKIALDCEEPPEGQFRGYVPLIVDEAEEGNWVSAFTDEETSRFLAEVIEAADHREDS